MSIEDINKNNFILDLERKGAALLAQRIDYQSELKNFDVKKIIEVRKPANDEFFRCDSRDNYKMLFNIIKYNGISYLVENSLHRELAKDIIPVIIYTLYTRSNDILLWHFKAHNGKWLDTWSQSGHDAMEVAVNKWVRLSPNSAKFKYNIITAEGKCDEPVWTDKSFQELLSFAFKNKVINSMNHHVVCALNGMK